ncbi:MAG TPA: flagellar basal body P-ring protein FlgI [Terriglobales bacterium]|nr:flagellar basal body P-ring protein FlgI [Terriglobales bacterium]
MHGKAVFVARPLLVLVIVLAYPGAISATEPVAVKIRDLTSIEGVRENPLIGYGMVVGLTRTGDSQQTAFTTQTLANIMQRMGATIPAATARVNNVASVFVTASLPAFARPGTQVDVTVSSIGDAKSLEGGLLLLTQLYGADGQVYAAAQGPVAVGGFAAGGAGASKQMNHPTVGRVPAGGRVERSLAFDFNRLAPVSLLLRESDFSTAGEISDAINREFGRGVASARDGGRVEVDPGATGVANLTAVLARIENLVVAVHRRARVVVNERTGTIVMGKDVRLGAVSILHGGFSVQISTEYSVSQPAPLSSGTTEVVGKTEVQAKDSPARRLEIGEGASIDDLVSGLQNMGATARDVISILQAIKAAGALDADLEVI